MDQRGAGKSKPHAELRVYIYYNVVCILHVYNILGEYYMGFVRGYGKTSETFKYR